MQIAYHICYFFLGITVFTSVSRSSSSPYFEFFFILECVFFLLGSAVISRLGEGIAFVSLPAMSLLIPFVAAITNLYASPFWLVGVFLLLTLSLGGIILNKASRWIFG